MARTRKPRGLRLQAWFVTKILRFMLRTLARFKFFNVKATGRDNVPKTGRVILAANHLSYADAVLLGGAIKRRRMIAIAMAELWKWPGVNVLAWSLGHIPVERGNSESHTDALDNGVSVLEHEGVLAIFPEGKISKDGTLLRFKHGVGTIAFRTNAPVVPVGIVGTNAVWPLGSKKLYWRKPLEIHFGEPLLPSDFTGPDAVQDFLDELHRRVEALSTGKMDDTAAA